MPSPAVKGRGCLAWLPRILAARIARGGRVAPGPMARRCSHLMMIAPAGRPTATEACPRRPEGLFGFQPNRLPGRLPVVALRMPYPRHSHFPMPCCARRPHAASRRPHNGMHGATGSWKQIAVRLGTVMRTSFKALSPGVARHTTGYAFEDVYSTKFKPTAAIGPKHQVVFCRPVCSVCLWAVVQNQLPSICELFRR